MKIRKATVKDFKKVVDIFREEYGKPPYSERWSKQAAFKKIKEYYGKGYFFILEIDKEIQGFLIGNSYLWHDGIRGSIDELVISSKSQGKGYGSKLINYFEKFLNKKGIKKISLFSAKKSKAFKIYKKLGFKEEDFVSMVKKIK